LVTNRLPFRSQPERSASPQWWRGFLAPLAVTLLATAAAAIVLWLAVDTPSPISPAVSTSAWSPEGQVELRVVSADWLADALADPDRQLSVVALSPSDRYAAEHIPGAVHGWWQDGMDPHARAYGERYFPETDPEGRAKWFAALGIEPGDTVVVYDNEGNQHAARLVWLLVDSGHADAMILDGGLAAWKSTGQDVESGAPMIADGPAQITEHGALPVVTTDELEAILADPARDVTVVDVRDEDERGDTMKGVLPVGQIPGSVWLPREAWYADDGLLLPPDDLRRLLEDAGIAPGDTVVVYGEFGIDSGLPWVVLTALGHEDVRIYDQGWVTWAEDETRPIESLQGTSPE
jgi:thiosulfate/3-mercaptopyruvate sulfurtransferase